MFEDHRPKQADFAVVYGSQSIGGLPLSESHGSCLASFCLGTKVLRHSAGSVGTYSHLYIRAYVRMLYVNRICNQQYCFAHAQVYKPTQQYCKIGNSQCQFKFKAVVRLVYTHYKVQATQLHCGLH